jgi:signal transduction histidine kinase
MSAGEEVVGVLAVDNLLTDRAITRDQIEELFVFANAAAVAIQNARLYGRALQRSEDLAATVATQSTELREAEERRLRTERLAVIGRFAGRLAHDLRNPLNVLQLNLQLLRRRIEEDPQLLRPLDRVDQAVQQAATMVTDLLDFSRLGQPRPSETHIEPLLRRQIEETTAPEGIAVALEVEPDLPTIQADVEQLHQALRHLLSNALQAMRDRSGTITLAAHREPGGVAISVRDEGCGIDPELLERLFDPLFTTRARGTGLGLAVCRKIAEDHGGHIRVRSTPGTGAEFTIWLPVETARSSQLVARSS